MKNNTHKHIGFVGIGFCLLAGLFIMVGGDSVRAAEAAEGNAGRAFNNAVRQSFGTAGRTFGDAFHQTFDLRDIAIDAANGAPLDDYSIGAFRRNVQLRLLAALDGAVSGGGEDILRTHFSSVRKAEVDFQSALGGRKGHLGINLIGAFADSADDAFGWQLRAYGGQVDSAGINSGVFYRTLINDGALFGVNAFADYEKHRYGNFVRYSLGGEMQNKHFSLAANYYLPTTGDKRVNSTVIAFSRKGYDAKLRINTDSLRGLKAGLDYYHFDGDKGREDDDGFRFGGEWHPTRALQMGLFYDSGNDKFGGDIAYSWTIGGTSGGAGVGDSTFAPDLFAAVWREHTQRVALATVVVPGFVLSESVVNIPSTMTIGNINNNSPSALVSVLSPVEGFFVASGGALVFTASRTTPAGLLTATVSVSPDLYPFTIRVVPPPLPRYVPSLAGDLIFGGTYNIGIIRNGEAYFDDGDFAVSLSSDDASFSGGNVVLTAANIGMTIISITVSGMYGGAAQSYDFVHAIDIVRAGQPSFPQAVVNYIGANLWYIPTGVANLVQNMHRRPVGTVSVINTDDPGPFRYSLVANAGDGTGRFPLNCDATDEDGNTPNCRFELNTVTGEFSFFEQIEGVSRARVVARGMTTTLTAFLTVHRARMRGSEMSCSYDFCGPLGFGKGTLPTTAQVSMMIAAGYPISGSAHRNSDGIGSPLIPFVIDNTDDYYNSLQAQMSVSMLWTYMESRGADINTGYRRQMGEGSESANWTALDFVNDRVYGRAGRTGEEGDGDPDGRWNWILNKENARCNYACRQGQRRLSDNAVCTRNTDSAVDATTPPDCAP